MRRIFSFMLLMCIGMAMANAQNAETLAMRRLIDMGKSAYNSGKYANSFATFVKIRNNSKKATFEGTNLDEWISKGREKLQEYDYNGERHFQKNEYAAAMRCFMEVAKLEETEPATLNQDELKQYDMLTMLANCQYYIGKMYYDGSGTSKNQEKGKSWYRKSAELGNANAQLDLGCIYNNESNYTQAFRMFEGAATQNITLAQYMLGFYYEKGHGTAADNTKAFYWYSKAADNGHTGAQYKLGCCYRDGIGVSKNAEVARQWLKKAADAGMKDAKDALQKMNTRVMTGTVVDKKGEPLIGASILIKGTNLGAVCDIDGRFTLKNIPASATHITVSYIGYNKKTLPIETTEPIRIVMK